MLSVLVPPDSESLLEQMNSLSGWFPGQEVLHFCKEGEGRHLCCILGKGFRLDVSPSCPIVCSPELFEGAAFAARFGLPLIDCGFSHRSSLTYSSLDRPTVSLQRTLFLPGGGKLEPQEFPLPAGCSPALPALFRVACLLLAGFPPDSLIISSFPRN